MGYKAATYGNDPAWARLMLPSAGVGLGIAGLAAVVVAGPAGLLLTVAGIGSTLVGLKRNTRIFNEHEDNSYWLKDQTQELTTLRSQLGPEHVLIARLTKNGETLEFFVQLAGQKLSGVPRRAIMPFQQILALAEKDSNDQPAVLFMGRLP